MFERVPEIRDRAPGPARELVRRVDAGGEPDGSAFAFHGTHPTHAMKSGAMYSNHSWKLEEVGEVA
jgi:hypothetical protein